MQGADPARADLETMRRDAAKLSDADLAEEIERAELSTGLFATVWLTVLRVEARERVLERGGAVAA
jgi:hypothetical protein